MTTFARYGLAPRTARVAPMAPMAPVGSIAPAPLVALVALLLASLVGCAATGAPDGVEASDTSTVGSASLPVAVNLVSVLVQLDGYSPYETTVQVSEPTSDFGERLIEALELAGYGLQRVSADQGRNYLSYTSASDSGESGTRIDHALRLGDLSIAREVRLIDGAPVPVGPVRIAGAAPEPIALNGSIYVARPDRPLRYPSGVRFLDDDGVTSAEASYRYDYRPTGAARAGTDVAALDPSRFLQRATDRLYSRGRSTVGFAVRPDEDFAPLGQLALRFPTRANDVLGAGNRRALERLLEVFDADTDRLRLTSCDDGAPDDATSAAARSARVKSELLTLGVPGAQALEDGCPRRRYGAASRTVELRLERLIVAADPT